VIFKVDYGLSSLFGEQVFDEMATNLHSRPASQPETPPAAILQTGETAGRSIGRSNRHRAVPRVLAIRDYDHVGGLGRRLHVFSSSNYKVATDDAAALWADLLTYNGLEDQVDHVKLAFIDAVYFAHAFNGASLLMPDRAYVSFANGNDFFRKSFKEAVLDPLGDQARRFFRANADEIKTALIALRKRVSSGQGTASDQDYGEDCEMWDEVLRVASERGLTRVPHLIHDSSDACTGLDASERAYLAASKRIVLPADGVGNLVDNPVVARSQPVGFSRVGVKGGGQQASSSDMPEGY